MRIDFLAFIRTSHYEDHTHQPACSADDDDGYDNGETYPLRGIGQEEFGLVTDAFKQDDTKERKERIILHGQEKK